MTPSPTESPTPTPIEPHASAPALWSIAGAGLVVLALFLVQVLTCVGLKSHCKEMNKSIQESAGLLFRTIPFWFAQATLAGGLISVCLFFRYETMWGIVRIYAAFVLWCVVLAWFVAFQTEPVSDRIFCCCAYPPAAVRPQPVVCVVVWLTMPLRWLLGRH